MRREADRLVAEGSDFELVRAAGYANKAIELIDRIYTESNGEKILDVHEALEQIENELLNDNLKFAKLEKIRSHLGNEAHLPTTQTTQSSGMRTLTNRDGARPVMDKRSRALAAALGQLK
jgi:hypothetical protein